MFDSFQFHPRPTATRDDQDQASALDGLGLCLSTTIAWGNASETSFSTPIKRETAPYMASVAEIENQYESVEPSLSLSPREKEVLVWAGRGKSAWETAQLLGLSEATVKSYVRNACARLGVQNKTHAVAVCLTHGLFRI